jgi:hypothetical protein
MFLVATKIMKNPFFQAFGDKKISISTENQVIPFLEAWFQKIIKCVNIKKETPVLNKSLFLLCQKSIL